MYYFLKLCPCGIYLLIGIFGRRMYVLYRMATKAKSHLKGSSTCNPPNTEYIP